MPGPASARTTPSSGTGAWTNADPSSCTAPSAAGAKSWRRTRNLSAYINHSIRQDGQSIWIAQAEGRAKDGDDRTDSAILKMFHMSCKDEPFAELVKALNIVPVSISYEFDPCDQAKARELHTRATTGSYAKAPGEDDVRHRPGHHRLQGPGARGLWRAGHG